jgi:hypothetical protein
MNKNVRLAAAPLLLAAALGTGGCTVAAAAVGAAAAYGVVKYTENEAYEDFRAPFDATWRATLESLRENGYGVTDLSAPDTTEASYEVHDARITVQRMPGDVTRVKVRVGTFSTADHRRRAELVLEGVARRVG